MKINKTYSSADDPLIGADGRDPTLKGQNLEDRHLVDSILANQRGAFERLIGAYQCLCWDIIYRMVRNPEDAKELSQEVFLKVHRYLASFRYESTLKTWIARIAYSIALRFLQRKRIPLVELGSVDCSYDIAQSCADGNNLEQSVEDEQLVKLIRKAVTKLPPVERTLLGLYHFDELSISEISEITGLPNGTIKSHLHRARMHLRLLVEVAIGVAS